MGVDIPVYWVVNLVKQQIEVDTQPTQSGKQSDYRQHQIYQLADRISVTLDSNKVGSIAVCAVLPPSQ